MSEIKYRRREDNTLSDLVWDTPELALKANGWTQNEDGTWFEEPWITETTTLEGALEEADIVEVRAYTVHGSGSVRVSFSETVYASSEDEAYEQAEELLDFLSGDQFSYEPPEKSDFDFSVEEKA